MVKLARLALVPSAPDSTEIAVDDVRLFWLTTGIGAVAWSLVASSTTPRLSLVHRVTIVCAGVGATLVWFPAWMLATVLISLAMYMTLLGVIPLAIVPLVWWAAFCITLALSRSAVSVLLSAEGAE